MHGFLGSFRGFWLNLEGCCYSGQEKDVTSRLRVVVSVDKDGQMLTLLG